MLEDFSEDTEMNDENVEIQESGGTTSAEYAEEVRYFCSRKLYIVILSFYAWHLYRFCDIDEELKLMFDFVLINH